MVYRVLGYCDTTLYNDLQIGIVDWIFQASDLADVDATDVVNQVEFDAKEETTDLFDGSPTTKEVDQDNSVKETVDQIETVEVQSATSPELATPAKVVTFEDEVVLSVETVTMEQEGEESVVTKVDEYEVSEPAEFKHISKRMICHIRKNSVMANEQGSA